MTRAPAGGKAAKTGTKAGTKAGAKATPRTAAKPAAKPPAATKTTAKPAATKTTAKPAATKPTAKPAARKTTKPAAKKTTKPAPLTAANLHTLALAPPETTPGPGALAMIGGRLVLGAEGYVLSADPGAADWDLVHDSPARPLDNAAARRGYRLGLIEDAPAAVAMGATFPGAHAIGPFALYKGRSDKAACLYAGSTSLWGGRVLRSDDGRHFEPVSLPGFAADQDDTDIGDDLAIGALTAAPGWLVAAPSPLHHTEPSRPALNAEAKTRIFAAKNPAGGWTEIAKPGFGAGVTGGVTALATAHGHVYAAVENTHRGFALWRARPKTRGTWDWAPVLERGGHGYSHAPRVTAMAEFGDALYLASGISESGFGRDRAGPAAAEIMRVAADGSWNLIVGQPRFTPQGLKVPLSGRAQGFGDPYDCLVPALAVHDGILYAGTRNAEAEYQQRFDETPTPLRGGATLWASADGETWTPVMTGGGGSPALTGLAALWSAETGLYMAAVSSTALIALSAGLDPAEAGGDITEIRHGHR